MALNATQTATEIVAALDALAPEATAQERWQAVIDALYTRIKADMVVSSTVNVTSVSGVTPGGGVSGPGSGTATSSSVS